MINLLDLKAIIIIILLDGFLQLVNQYIPIEYIKLELNSNEYAMYSEKTTKNKVAVSIRISQIYSLS